MRPIRLAGADEPISPFPEKPDLSEWLSWFFLSFHTTDSKGCRALRFFQEYINCGLILCANQQLGLVGIRSTDFANLSPCNDPSEHVLSCGGQK
jgi:hypothetical protein